MHSYTLKHPPEKIREKILSELDFDERLTGYHLHGRAGICEVAIYSFEELVMFFENPSPRIDFEALVAWTGGVIGDTELAEKIKKVIDKNISGHYKTEEIKKLLHERLRQCQK